jgi:signal peptidase II
VALLTVIVIIALDQWTKALVVADFSPPESRSFPLVGQYLVIDYIQNRGAAFGILANTIFLALLIAAAVSVVTYLYLRIVNSGPLVYKLIFAMIIGGALGNLIDRVHNGGYVVDFIFFRIPEIGFKFAVFNIADACISVGVFLLFVTILFGGMRKTEEDEPRAGVDSHAGDEAGKQRTNNLSPQKSGAIRPTEQDAQS